jgi:hypothetical protein
MARSKRPDNRPDVNKLLNQFAAEEQEFLSRELLAPALRGGLINIRMSGVLCRMRTTPANFEGWGVFRPTSHTEANLVRPASLAERRNYLALFPMFRLIVCRRMGNIWFASAASFGDARINLEGMAPLGLAEEVQLFDCVRCRYDGSQFWFDERDMRHDPGTSAYLRAALADQTSPQDLERHGLTAEERAAYELNYWQLVQPPDADDDVNEPAPNALHRRRSKRPRPGEPAPFDSDPVRRRLRENLSHAGARLVDYLERGDSFRVRYRVAGHEYTSSVNKDDLTVQVAGICLSGEDQKFDLASLVGVLGEAARGVLRIGDEGMDEEQYWRVHPPRNR